MGQKITIRILTRPFTLYADTPEDETIIRNAADKVNEKYNEYFKSFPGKHASEILSFVALNAFIDISRMEEDRKKMETEQERLHKEIESYLENIDNI